MAEPVDFHRFGEELWNIANVLRGDILKVTEYLEEFSYFLFLKLLDDREKLDEELAQSNGRDFISLIPETYRFHNWAEAPERWAIEHGSRSIIDFLNQMTMELASIPDDIDVQSKITKDRKLIRKVFQHHIMRLRYPKTVTELTRRLAALELAGASYDVLGRAYEFVIQKLGEQGQYGQYFTPRHIIKFMVGALAPQIGETIYDPAAGTGGFLVWAYESVIKKIESQFLNSVDQEIKIRELRQNLYGAEKAPDVFKLGIMNLILHGDGSANFEEADSLSAPAQDAHKNKYQVILTNPPFGPLPYDPSGVFEYPVKLFEACFLQHMMNALRPGGRCATIMKEGLLFSNSPRSLLNIRKRLVDEFNVRAVVSLPSGVFLPYTGSKTSILIFEKPKDASTPRTNEVWFYRVENDGFELGATRRPLSEMASKGEMDGDLPDTLAKFKKGQESDQSWLVSAETIRQSDYNLTAGRYCPYKEAEEEYEEPEVLISQLIGLEEEIQDGLKELSALVGEGVQSEVG